MGLFDRFRSKSDANKPDNELSVQNNDGENKPAIISRAIAERECNLSNAVKIPFTDTALAGGSLMQLAPSLKAFVTGNEIGNGSLVRVTYPAGVSGSMAVDKAGQTLGTILKDEGGLAQARFVAVDPVTLATQAAMAAVLMQINKKLDTIQATQQQILSFLEQDKQAEQQANLNILTDILDGYKHNWDNAQFLQNHHMKALDIKQSAEKNILFYQEQVAAAIKKLPAVHRDQDVKAAIANLGKPFAQYRMALYMYSFSAFLEVMLLGNFQQAYLDQVADKVLEYSRRYQTQFAECGDMIKRYSSESFETWFTTGIGNMGKTIGRFIGSVPLISKGPVDEWLQEGGEKLLKGNDEKAQNAAASFAAEGDIGNEPFIDSIRNVAAITNDTTDILFDGEALYLAGA